MYPLACLKVISLLAIIRAIYGVVKMNGYIRIVNLNVAFSDTYFLWVTFKALGQMYVQSNEVLVQQKRRMGDKWFRRFHRSCPPLKFQVAGLYFADPPMCLTAGYFVLENVANMLMIN